VGVGYWYFNGGYLFTGKGLKMEEIKTMPGEWINSPNNELNE